MAKSQYLKEAKTLFLQNKFEDALRFLSYHLEDEPEDVRALVLKGAAEQRLHEDKKSIDTFKKALEYAPKDTTIWKGLIRSYFQTKEYDEYFDAAVKTLVLIAESPDRENQYKEALNIFERCQQFISKNSFKASVATRSRLLEMQLPLENSTSPELKLIYEMFEGQIFPNYSALDELISLRRKELATTISKLKAREKTSINFSSASANNQTLEAIRASNLEALLKLKISVEDNDEARREAESELLRLLVDTLASTSKNASKTELQTRIKNLAEGMTMFEPQNPLAVELSWDWDSSSRTSHELIGQEDESESPEPKDTITSEAKYVKLFPKAPLARVLAAHSSTEMVPSEKINVYKQYNGECVYGWTIIASDLLAFQSYGPTIDVVHSGLKAIKARREMYGMALTEAEQDLTLALAKAYTKFEAPKNFALAQDLFDQVLSKDPNNVDALVGKGVILSQADDYEGAIKTFRDVLAAYPDNAIALSEMSWSRIRNGDIEEGIRGLEECLAMPSLTEGSADIKWRIGYGFWMLGEREKGFEWFVATLKESPAHAAAYTYLGLFYQDVAQDDTRAKRCFFKALELDNGQAIAGERLAIDFARSKQWYLVEVVAKTVMSSGKLQGPHFVDWPYRAMGISCINNGRSAEAVKYFQRCLRKEQRDIQAWIGLGEAYMYSGKHRSGEKALGRALKLDPTSFPALYVMSLTQRAVPDYPASADSLKKALEYAPKSSSVLLWALADNSLLAAKYYTSESMLGEALDESRQALEALEKALSEDNSGRDSAVMWGTVAEVLMLLHRIGRITLDDVPTFKPLIQRLNSQAGGDATASELAALACSAAAKYVELAADGTSKARRATSHFYAALTNAQAGRTDVAVAHFKKSIVLEPKNDTVWSAYGVCVQSIAPMVAQHCYVRSLTLNGRRQDTWVNLAALYIMHNDAELADEAIERALSLDSEYCPAWIGKALVDSLQGTKSTDYLQRMLHYAYSLTNNDPLASYAMALKDYEAGVKAGVKVGSATLGALEKLLATKPRHRDAQLIMGLIMEQRGDYEGALARLEPLGEWCHVARVHLALGQYEAAIDAANKNTSSSEEAVLSQLLTIGLASYFLDDFEAAIESFTLALENENTEDVLRLLVEVLYANGSEESRQIGSDQLFDSISTHGPTLQVTILLGVLGLLNKDDAVIDAARIELKAQITPEVRGESLAQACHVLSLLEDSNSSFQRAIFQWPTDYALWRRVDKQQALLVAEGNTTNSTAMSQAYTEAGGVTNCQRAVFYEPTSEAAWRGLANSFVSR